jgi:hypothetical protein
MNLNPINYYNLIPDQNPAFSPVHTESEHTPLILTRYSSISPSKAHTRIIALRFLWAYSFSISIFFGIHKPTFQFHERYAWGQGTLFRVGHGKKHGNTNQFKMGLLFEDFIGGPNLIFTIVGKISLSPSMVAC